MRMDRYGMGLFLAVSVLVAGSAVVGCGSEDPPPSQPSEGGSGGGGEGGGGGGGGGEPEERCGGAICSPGESCVKNRCECTQMPDSCEENDAATYCNANRICAPRPPEPTEYGPCSRLGDTADGGLVCVRLGNNAVWMVECETSNDCGIPYTVCHKELSEGEFPYCHYNHCGQHHVDVDETGKPILDDEGNEIYLNGRNWGECDVTAGLLEEEGTGGGNCVPFNATTQPLFLCVPTGTAAPGESCRVDAARTDADSQCSPGSSCEGQPLYTKPCSRDADCEDPAMACNAVRDGVQHCGLKNCEEDSECGEGRHCHAAAKQCVRYGKCQETCNSGKKGEEGGEYAGCGQDPLPQECRATGSGNPAWDDAMGACQNVCELFDEESCVVEGGKPMACRPVIGDWDRPKLGTCEETIAEPRQLGETCGATPGVEECGEGLACIEGTCMALCYCTGSWSHENVCSSTPAQCQTGDRCALASSHNPRLGVCIPAQ